MGQERADELNASLSAVEKEIDHLRARTQRLIEELENRVHHRVDSARHTVQRVKHAVSLPVLTAQIREHPRAATGIAVCVAAAIGLGASLAASCATSHFARPLGRGNAVGQISLGGPIVEVADTPVAAPILVAGAGFVAYLAWIFVRASKK